MILIFHKKDNIETILNMRRKDDKMFKLYKIHDELTDKKLLKTITKVEEKELEKIRDEIESHGNDSSLTRFYKNRVVIYQKILDELERLKN